MALTFQGPVQYCSFTALDLTFITSHIHNRVLFLLWLHLFILSVIISPLFSVTYWAPTVLGSSSFSVISFCLFTLFLAGKSTDWYSSLGKMFSSIFWSCTYLYQAILFLGETCIIVPRRKCTKYSQQPIHKRPKLGTARR